MSEDAIAPTTRAHIRSARDPRHTLCWINTPFSTPASDESAPCQTCFEVANKLVAQDGLHIRGRMFRRMKPAAPSPGIKQSVRHGPK